MPLILAFLLFTAFAANVVMGSVGIGGFLGDIPEMLVLFAATIAFVVAILKSEAAEKQNKKQQN